MTYAIGTNQETCAWRACCQPASEEVPQAAHPEHLPTLINYCQPHAFRLVALAHAGLQTWIQSV